MRTGHIDHAAGRARDLRLPSVVLALLGVWAWLQAPAAWAGTTGKLTGKVTDQAGKPVVAATVQLVGTRLGAYSGEDGQFIVLNVPAGTYEVKVARLGFETTRVQNIIVSADQSTRLDVKIKETAVEMEEVVVVAERPPVQLEQTSTTSTLTAEDIEALPVQQLDDVVNLQAGVVDGHFRGGRIGEVQYQVDGVSVNNAYDNKSSVRLDRSLLQEVQVISGTFDAEYGQAMSGVVNAVLKDGTDRFKWDAELYQGAFVFPGSESRRLTDDDIRPGDIQSYQATVSGPTNFHNTTFLLSGRRYVFDDYVQGTRTFVPTDRSDFEQKIFYPSGDGGHESLTYSREWSGVLKLSNTSLKNSKISYQFLLNDVQGRSGSWAYRFNPDGQNTQHTFAITHGTDWTYTLGANQVMELSLRHNYFKYTDWAYEDLYDPRYDAAGPVEGDYSYERGAIVQGVSFGRFQQRTNSLLLKGSLLSQMTPEHQIKLGGEIQQPHVEFGPPGYLVETTVTGGQQTIRRYDNQPPDYPGLKDYFPIIGAAYVQEASELPDLTVRAGLRLDFFDANSVVPSDLGNPANAIPDVPTSTNQRTSVKVSLSPRLGVAYPIEDKAAIHVAYGHFRQFPAIGQVFANSDYSILANLQAGVTDYGVLGNPDVRPERTTQYEVGYKHALTPDLGADLTIFYKDVRDLLGVEFISTYNDAEYARLTNVDFGSILGFTLAIDHRKLGPVSLSCDYTWQQALGNSSDPRETATRAQSGQDPRPRLIPFGWDQRHTFNLTATLSRPDAYIASAVVRVGSGQPYTPVYDTGFNGALESNSGRRPTGLLVDIRGERTLSLFGRKANLFARGFNLLDSRYFNGFVFDTTGSPYYSRFPETDAVTLSDPTRYYPPRRVELGIRFGG